MSASILPKLPAANTMPIQLGGMVPLTTIDYPDHLSCVLFCQGCAWRCHYCHNPDLIAPVGSMPVCWEQVLAFLHQRQGLLQAVVFSGGEATLQPGLAVAMQQVCDLGFKVGLHTAGIKPAALHKVLPLCDWVGFDIKAPRGQVDHVTQIIGSDAANWRSLELLLESSVAYECRTTVHWALLEPDELICLARQLQQQGVSHFVVQLARSGQMLNPDLPEQIQPKELPAVWQTMEGMFEYFSLRT